MPAAPPRADLARRIEPLVRDDLRSKMVFVAGPRQCGKTTLAERLLRETTGAYFNWDVDAHRQALREQALPESAALWVFDELHKRRGWQSWLKGVYDLHHARHAMLVTGSARLDVWRRGGDSLQGRYLMYRLHPFTLSEVCGGAAIDEIDRIPALPHAEAPRQRDALEALMTLGGFPEPFVRASERFAARWRLGYGSRLVRGDLRDLEAIRDLDKVERMLERLPALVGSPLSVNALREDLEIAFGTAESWLAALERMYAIYRVPPFGLPRIRAVKKAQKAYLWDWSRVERPAARAENLVMSHLLRFTHFLCDVHGEKAELRFFRDVQGHEVDAVVLRKGKPWLAVEIKEADGPLDAGLRYLLERVAVPHAFQVSMTGAVDRFLPDVGRHGVRLVSAARLLANLP